MPGKTGARAQPDEDAYMDTPVQAGAGAAGGRHHHHHTRMAEDLYTDAAAEEVGATPRST